MMKKLLIASVFALTLIGCASVPMGDPKLDAALKTFKAPADKAGIYVFRNETMGAAIKMNVTVDDQPIGQTAANTYLYKEVAPGKHTVASLTENKDVIEVEVKAGTLVYIWQEVKMGFMSARSKLQIVSEAIGKKGVSETKLAAGN